MNTDERITSLEERVTALEQENDACHKMLGKLMAQCQQVIDMMQPALVALSLSGQAMTGHLEDEGALTIEQMNELRVSYYRNARKVERAYAQTLLKTQGFTI